MSVVIHNTWYCQYSETCTKGKHCQHGLTEKICVEAQKDNKAIALLNTEPECYRGIKP